MRMEMPINAGQMGQVIRGDRLGRHPLQNQARADEGDQAERHDELLVIHIVKIRSPFAIQ